MKKRFVTRLIGYLILLALGAALLLGFGPAIGPVCFKNTDDVVLETVAGSIASFYQDNGNEAALKLLRGGTNVCATIDQLLADPRGRIVSDSKFDKMLHKNCDRMSVAIEKRPFRRLGEQVVVIASLRDLRTTNIIKQASASVY